MQVGGRTNAPQFSARSPGFECLFDYSEWLAANQAPLAVQTHFDQVPAAFSMHFGFSSPTNGDPFRLLVVNENHPPPPLYLAREFVRNDRQGLPASLNGALWQRLCRDFHLLDGRQWQLQPFIKPKSRPVQYLYKDWPVQDMPAFGCELDFTNIGWRLRAQRQALKKTLDGIGQRLGRPLGKSLDWTDASLDSFRSFSPSELSPGRFLAYLDVLRKSAPEKSWIKKWHNRFDSDQADEVSAKFQELYFLWMDKRPQDQPMLTVTNAGGATNYFFAAWQLLKEAESLQEQLGQVEKRIDQLDQVAYIGLCIVDPRQPKPGLEMIRFGGP
jgi:hypothetical protein